MVWYTDNTRERTTRVALKSAQTMGDILPLADVVGHLLLIAPTEYVTDIATKFTKDPSKLSDAIRCDVAVLTQQDEQGGYGVVYRGCLWFNIIRLSLRKSIPDTANGDAVLARVGQGAAQQGQDPPYVLVDAMSDSDAVAFAEQWLAAHPEFMTVAQAEARRVASEGPTGQVPPGQTVPGVGVNAGPPATAPSVAPVPTANTNKAAPVGNVALPGMGGQATQGGGAAAIPNGQPTAAADLLAALSPEERAALKAALA